MKDCPHSRGDVGRAQQQQQARPLIQAQPIRKALPAAQRPQAQQQQRTAQGQQRPAQQRKGQQGQPQQRPQTVGRVYAMTHEDAEEAGNVIEGKLVV